MTTDPFARVPLGTRGPAVPAVGFGTGSLIGSFEGDSEEVALETVREGLRRGHRFFDTAPYYGYGRAERAVGRALAEEGVAREEVVLSTKVGRRLVEPAPGRRGFYAHVSGDVVRDYSYDGTLAVFEGSLERLGTDHVELLLVHDPDDHVEEALAGALRAAARLRDEGVVRAIGVGMLHADAIERFVREAPLDVVLCAGEWTLLAQRAQPLLELCAERGVGYLAAGAFNGGLLARPVDDTRFNYLPAPQEVLDRVARIDAVCRRHGVELPAAALAFTRGHPRVDALVLGHNRPPEVAHNLALLEAEVPGELWQELVAAGLLPADVPLPGGAA